MRARVVGLLVTVALLLSGGVALGWAVQSERVAAAAVAKHEAATRAEAARLSAAALRRQRGAADGLQDPVPTQTAKASTAVPTRVVIPAIQVDAPLERLHRDAKGVLQPPTAWADAGWYADGVVPGAIGPAIIAGHLDTTLREAVFVHLQQLRPGDRILVKMSDGRTLHFTVDRSRVVKKALFPTQSVYGPTPDAQLRLITCNEPFDEVHGIYADNLVVDATERTS